MYPFALRDPGVLVVGVIAAAEVPNPCLAAMVSTWRRAYRFMKGGR
jgi:hypothetical protein